METVEQSQTSFSWIKKQFSGAGNFAKFTLRFFEEVFRRPYNVREILVQCFRAGYQSLPLVGSTAFIMGLVLTIQSRPSLVTFGAEAMLPGLVSVSVIKEIGPVITALICAGKISSRIGAELGAMRVTEQIDAMEVSAINPYKYLVVTRTIATTMMIPILVFFADAIALCSGFIAVNIRGDVSLQGYFSQAMSQLDFIDIIPAVAKTFFFGFMIGMIGCFKGFSASQGTASVGRAANSAVVAASVSIFLIDLITVQITDLL